MVLAGIFGLCLPGAAQAASTLDAWRSEAGRTRSLAENDLPRAYEAAQRLQAMLPAHATPTDQARLLNLLSRIELYRAQTGEAEKLARQAMELAKQNGDRVGQAEANLNLALSAVNQSRIEDSVAATNRALADLDGVDRPDLLGEAMLRTAMMYRRKGQFDESVTLSMHQMEIARRTNTPLVLAYAYQGLAIAYDQSGHKKEASEYFTRMLEQARAVPSKLLEADALLGLGNVVAHDSDLAKGEGMIREAVAIYRTVGGPFFVGRGIFALADLLRQHGRPADALPLFDEAAAIWESHANRIGLWWTLNARSETQQALGHFAAAQADAERAYKLAREIDLTLYLGESAKRLAAIAALHGDYQKAYRFSLEETEMEARAEREKTSTRMVELANRYQTESKQREIDELSRRNTLQAFELQRHTLQQRWITTVLGGSVVILIGSGLFLLRLRRSNRLLEALNKQVQRSKNQLQATFDAIPDPLFVLGLAGRCYDCHSSRADFLAAPAEDLIGKTVSDILPPGAADICMSALREAHEKGGSTGKQFELQLAHGKFWFELSVARKPVDPGQEPRFVVLSRDITERKRAEELLHVRDQEFRVMVEHSPDIIARYDTQCRHIYVNPAMQAIFGLPVEKILGRTPLENAALPEAQVYVERIQGVFKTGQESRMEFRYDDVQGGVRWGDMRLVPEFSLDGAVTSVLGVSRDMTDIYRMQEALAAREREFSSLAENLPDNITRWDVDGRYLYINPVHERTLGVSANDMIGKATPDSHTFVKAAIAQIVATGQAAILVHQSVVVDGETQIHEVSLTLEYDAEGHVVSVLGIGRDMTDIYRIQEAIVARESEFHALVDQAPEPIFRYAPDGRRIYVNAAAERISGIPASVLLGGPSSDGKVLPAHEGAAVVALIQRIFETGEPGDIEVENVGADGRLRHFYNRLAPEFGADGKVRSVFSICHDITERKQAEDALREREQRYRGIFDNVLDTLYLLEVTPDGRFRNLDVNPAFEKSSGMPSAELIGKFIEETMPQEVAEIVIAKYRRCIEAGTVIDEEVTLDMPSGLRHYHSSLVPVRDDSGRIYRIVGISRDITERKRAEELLHAGEQALRAVVENSPDCIVRYDTQCRRIYVNPAMQALFDLPIEELLGKTPTDFPPLTALQTQVYMEETIRAVLESGQERQIEFPFCTAMGESRWEHMRLVPEFSRDEAVVSVLTVTRDITLLKDVELRLHASEQMFRAIVENTPDLIVRMDRQCRRIYVNPAVEHLGINASSLLGKRPLESVMADSPQALASATRVQELVMQVLQTGQLAETELSWVMPDGKSIDLDVQYVPELDPQGHVASVLSIARDISGLKRMERHLEESQQLLRLLAARNETAREDERKYLKREIHDELGQYLLALRLGISVVDLQFGVANAPLHEKTQRLIQMVDSTIKVVRNVVASLRPAALDMGIVSALEWLADEYSGRTGIQCELHISEENIDLDDTFATAIFRIVQESLTNIVRHAQASKVEITLERNEGNYFLEVRDNGVGFDPAVRKEKSFGLVSIRERALMLGGEVEIFSAPGRGTAIRVIFPFTT